MTDFEFASVQNWFYRLSGCWLPDTQRKTVEAHIETLLAREPEWPGFESLSLPESSNREAESLSAIARQIFETLLVNETFFFRNAEIFQLLQHCFLPEMIARRGNTKFPSHKLRFWCAACASGQEVWSLALVLQAMRGVFPRLRFDILGTDISPRMIERSRQGQYSQFEIQRGMPAHYLKEFFLCTPEGDSIVRPALREGVRFMEHNLIHAALPETSMRFDVILCRNILIYLDAAMARRVLRKLSDALATDGILVLGGAENASELCAEFENCRENHMIFRRRRREAA